MAEAEHPADSGPNRPDFSGRERDQLPGGGQQVHPALHAGGLRLVLPDPVRGEAADKDLHIDAPVSERPADIRVSAQEAAREALPRPLLGAAAEPGAAQRDAADGEQEQRHLQAEHSHADADLRLYFENKRLTACVHIIGVVRLLLLALPKPGDRGGQDPIVRLLRHIRDRKPAVLRKPTDKRHRVLRHH